MRELAATKTRKVRTLVDEMHVVECRADALVVGIAESLIEMARGASAEIEDVVRQASGRRWPVAIVALRDGRVLSEEERTAPERPAAEATKDATAPTPAATVFDRGQAENHPLIRAAVTMFGAKVVDVRPRRAPGQPG